MDEKKTTLQVRLFGKEKIVFGNKIIVYGRSSITKGMRLLFLLLYYGKQGVERSRMLEELYGRENLADAANNLRVTIHRLKKMLVDAGLPEYEYILYRSGSYYWNSPMETVLDTDVFRELITAAQVEEEEKKLKLLTQACVLYGGEFLQRFSDMEWVLMESIQFKEMYVKALQETCNILFEKREYEKALKLLEQACEIYPFDDWQAVKIDCYIGMNRYQEALKEYENTSKMLIEKLGISPSEKMMERFQAMTRFMVHRPQIIGEIKEGLNEGKEENGALFCAFPGFRDAYHIMKRGMERSGQSVFLLLCTLVDGKGQPMKQSKKTEEMAEELQNVIQNSLRKSDSFTKYNHSQFLVMLVGTNKENCKIVTERIVQEFAKDHKTWMKHIECSVTSLLDESK